MTFDMPAFSIAVLASALEVPEMSMDVNLAYGLFDASVMVCAPTPHPASRIVSPSPYQVSS